MFLEHRASQETKTDKKAPKRAPASLLMASKKGINVFDQLLIESDPQNGPKYSPKNIQKLVQLIVQKMTWKIRLKRVPKD